MGADICKATTETTRTDTKEMTMRYLHTQKATPGVMMSVNGWNQLMRTWLQMMLLLASVVILFNPVTAHAQSAELSSDGALHVTGSGKNEWITIEGSGEGELSVKSGKQANVLVGSYTGVVSVMVAAKGGRNQIELTEVSVPGSVGVTAKGGNDAVTFRGQIDVGGDLDVDLNGGNNTINAKNASISVQGSAAFDGNGGKDKVTLTSIVTDNHLVIDTAGGVDKIVLGKRNSYQVSVGQRLMVKGGRGQNTINVYGAEVASAISLMSGGEADKYTVEDTSTESFFDVKSGGGDDRIVSRNNTVMEDYRIRCGGGSDRVVTKNDEVGELVQKRCED